MLEINSEVNLVKEDFDVSASLNFIDKFSLARTDKHKKIQMMRCRQFSLAGLTTSTAFIHSSKFYTVFLTFNYYLFFKFEQFKSLCCLAPNFLD